MALPKLAGHSQTEGKYVEMVDGIDANGNPIKTPVEKDILISVGPLDHDYGQGDGLKWEMAYVKSTLKGYSQPGENVSYLKPDAPVFLPSTLRNVNGKWLSTMTDRLNSGRNLLITGRLKYGLLYGYVNYNARALFGAGVLNVNALLPVTAPVLLNAEMAIRQVGIYVSPYLNTFR